MAKFKCLIVDDEPLAIEVIETYLNRLDNFEIVGSYTEPVEGFVALKGMNVDLLFIDIEMPEFNGLDFIKTMSHSPKIIITTAYRDFAVDGFDLNILDYLLKPITFERFMKSINKFLDQILPGSIETNSKKDSFIIVRADRKHIKISLEEILYVQGLKDYVKIVLKNQTILTKKSIGNFYKELDAKQFMRIHKSYIVALNKITAYTKNDVEIGLHEIPIGQVYRTAFLDLMNQ